MASSQSWNHDVFLSFRGEDTRKTFVDHLYSALVQQGIHTYKDDETLPRGKSIGPFLLKAIQESRISIIIFSRNYADSSWCLDELACIIKCMTEREQIVMPIFYHVDPSEVQEQTGKYGEAFAKHNLDSNNKVDSWRKALRIAGNLSGWVPKNIANGHEAKCIKEIVDTISHKLHQVNSSADENLIGVEARVEDLKSKLQMQSGGVLMIGIWGVGGGGKTTLASSVYEEISGNFNGCCFVENIREESSKYGLEKLQEKVLCSVLKQKQLEVGRVGEGKQMIKSKLCHRKVLIILDDVDHLDHLNALAGSHEWFGEGSRIIITTRDMHLLNAHKVNVIHNISLLNNDEATKLFCKHAPQEYRPTEDYTFLSKEVVSYAGGLPLALKVLGCFLCDRDTNEWRSALARLKEIPDSDIVEKLKISYDGLKPVEKELFLDIACFFRRKHKDWPMMFLDACGFYPDIGVKVLVQKALITISNGIFDMHDLIQEMGHHIVRGEHPKNPENHSRVWQKEDVLNICSMHTTTQLDKIQAIKYYCYTDDSWKYFVQIVANMKKLRWIDVEIDKRVETARHGLPVNFPPRELCCLILINGSQNYLWDGYKYLPNLRMIKLRGLKNLTKTPDFDGLPNLEIFVLSGSPNLKEIHSSIGRLEMLVCVIISGCFQLQIFPPIIRLKNLKTLSLSHCRQLFHLSEIQQKRDNVNDLALLKRGKEVSSYKQFSKNIFGTCWSGGWKHNHANTEIQKVLADRVTVDVESCLEGHPFPHKSMNHIGLQLFHPALSSLNLSHCNLGDEDIDLYVWELPNLQELILKGNKFSQLPCNLLQLPQLKWLNVSSCGNLVNLSGLPSSINVLTAEDCFSLEILDILNCKWLWKVSLMGWNRLGPLGGDTLLHSMLQGNAIEDHFMSLAFEQQIPKGFMARLIKGDTFTLEFPHNWYNDFCGFLIRVDTHVYEPSFMIIINRTIGKDSPTEVWQDYIETLKPCNDARTFVGYVSFSSLRHTEWWNSTCNIVSFSLDIMFQCSIGSKSRFGAELIPRKSKSNLMQSTKVTTDCPYFWDEEVKDRKTFTIQHDSNSSIKILWRPYYMFRP